MKLHLIILICLILFSCKDKRKDNLETMESDVKTFLNDQAFKDNYKLKIIEFKSFGYDTVNENYLDTLKLLSAMDMFDHFKKLTKNAIEIARLKNQQYQIYSSLGDKNLNDINKEDFEKAIKDANEYRDSMTKYNLLDSNIRERIIQRKKPENIYKAKFFIKATASKNGKDENMLDTLYIYFDKNIKIINLNQIN